MTTQRVSVGSVLELRRRAVVVELDRQYEEIGVRSFGRGIFHKEPVSGAGLGSKRVFHIQANDLVISNVFAWEGAVAVATESDVGKIGSHRFMTFVPTDGRIDTAWASWFFRSEPGLELIRHASPGSAGRNRTLAIARFEALQIPLPQIDEQRRIAARLDNLQRRATQLGHQSHHAKSLAIAFAGSLAARPDLDDQTKVARGWRRVPLGEVMKPAKDMITVQPNQTYPNAGILSFGRGMFVKPDIDGSRTSAKVLHRLHAGQFIYSRLFAFEGSYASVSVGLDGYFVSSEFPAFDADTEQLDAKWIATYLRSPDRWAELASSSKGLGVRRQRVPVEAVQSYTVWLPPIHVQRSAVAVMEKLDQANLRRAYSDARCSSMVPSALNQAFADLS